jgi:hypothetical protein
VLHEAPLIVFQAVRRAGPGVVEAISAKVFEHRPRPVLEGGSGGQLQVGLERQARRLSLSGRALGRQCGQVESTAFQDGWLGDLGTISVAVLGEDGPNGLVLPHGAAGAGQRRRDFFGDRRDSAVGRNQAPEREGVARGVALGLLQADHAVGARGAGAPRRDDGAVDAA